MSRNKYDACAYTQNIRNSVSALDYMLDSSKFNHCSKCRPELGTLGGSGVSQTTGNFIDLENDLRGANRLNSHCPAQKWLPTGKDYVQGKDAGLCIKTYPKVSTNLRHLKSCQLIDYAPIPSAPEVVPYKCPKCGH